MTEPKPTLVLVDDSDEVRALVRTRLQLSGMFDIVGEGRDGSEAIGLAYRHEPDLLLLDASMPIMDGLEALPAILTLAPETRVVMFTGFEERGLADIARELGAADFVEKSLPIDELAARLWQAIDGRPGPGPERQRLRVVSGVRREDALLQADQEVLDEHMERFREVFEQAAIGMATLTLNGSIARANRALAELMGCGPEDLVGVDYGRLTGGRGDVLDADLQAIVTEGASLLAFEHPLVGAEPRTVRVTLAPVRDSKGQPLYVFAQVQDISGQRAVEDELRRSEERFRLLVTAVADYAIYMLDPQGHVVSWNAGAQRIKGYAAREIIGQHFRVFYPAEDQETRHPEHNLATALRNGAYAEEGWRIRKDGSRFWASVVITAVYDDRGRHIGFAKVTHDQTEHRVHRQHQQEAVEQQNHLLAVTAHELRTPTAVIDGSVTLMQDRWDELTPADRAQLFSSIGTSAHRLQRLVSDLVAASRVQGDALTLRLESVSLRELLTAAIERTRAANSGMSVELSLDGDLAIVADPGRLGQALDNLLDNAVRHGRPPVEVTGRATADGVEVTVEDSGTGVEPELLPRLFDRFAIAGRSGGTGLGLHLVREIARRHGGEADYQPASEEGPAAFVLTLPGEPAIG